MKNKKIGKDVIKAISYLNDLFEEIKKNGKASASLVSVLGEMLEFYATTVNIDHTVKVLMEEED